MLGLGPVRFCALMRQSEKTQGQLADDAMDHRIAWSRLSHDDAKGFTCR